MLHETAKHYDKAAMETTYEKGDSVLLWDKKLSTKDRNKIRRLWLGLYTVQRKFGNVGLELTSEVCAHVARGHANRLQKIDDSPVWTGDPKKRRLLWYPKIFTQDHRMPS